MVNRNIQMKKKNNDVWENLFPLTLSENVFNEEGINLNEYHKKNNDLIEDKINKVNENLTNDLNNVKETLTTDLNERGINVLNPPNPFKSLKGDGITDDRENLQEILDNVSDGTKIIFPKPEKFYNIASSNPNYINHGIILEKDNLILEFESGSYYNDMLKATVPLTSLIYVPKRIDGLIMKNIYLNGNNLVDYAFKADEEYVPYATFDNCHFSRSKLANFTMATFVTTLNKCLATWGKQDGFVIKGLNNGISTSTTFNSCYANTNNRYGFVIDNITYSSLNSCASDHNDVGYYINGGYGIGFNGCGAESCRKAFLARAYLGLTINGFYSLYLGKDDQNDLDYLFEFRNGRNVTLSGIETQNNRNYSKKLGLTSSTHGDENITVLDDSFTRENTEFVSNYKFERPIKFIRGDQSEKDRTFTIEADELPDLLRSLEDMEINHTYTIQINDGKQSKVSRTWGNSIIRLKGSGRLNILGNPSNNKNVSLQGSFQRIRILNSNLSVNYKNLSIHAGSSGTGEGFDLVLLENAKNVMFENVHFNSEGFNSRNAIRALKGSQVKIINCTSNGPFTDLFFNDLTSYLENDTI